MYIIIYIVLTQTFFSAKESQQLITRKIRLNMFFLVISCCNSLADIIILLLTSPHRCSQAGSRPDKGKSMFDKRNNLFAISDPGNNAGVVDLIRTPVCKVDCGR